MLRYQKLLKNIFAKCFVVVLLSTLVFQVSPSTTFFASDAFDQQPILTRPAPRRAAAMGLEISGEIPEANFDDEEFNKILTERFNAQVNSFIQQHQASALYINFTTKTVEYQQASEDGEHFISVVITMEAISATTTVAVATTVINTDAQEIITLDHFSINAIALANNHIRGLIARTPRGFVQNFGGIDTDHPFYLENNQIVIPFGSSELFASTRGLRSIRMSLGHIHDEIVPGEFVYTLPAEQYSTRMVRLSPVLQGHGYTTNWNSQTLTIEIFDDVRLVASLTVDENAFSYGSSPERHLEVAPMLRHSRVYVPLSFFDEIMGMTVTITPDGYIIISRYSPPIDEAMTEYAEPTARPLH